METPCDAQLDVLAQFSTMPQEQVLEMILAEQMERKREFERAQAEAGSCYTPEFLARVARECRIDIDADKIPTIRQILSFSAWLYRDRKSEEEQALKLRQIRNEISDVHEAVIGLRSALDSLSPEAVDRLWAAQHDLDGLALFSDCTKSPFGHTIMRVRYGDAVELRYLRTPQLTEAVEVIGNLAAKASKSLYRDLGGRPSDGALWIWVVNMQNLWVKVLGRKFTYDTHCGEGSTDAFRFCQMLMRPLDPRVTGTQLGSVMRKAIRLSRKCKPVPKSQPAR